MDDRAITPELRSLFTAMNTLLPFEIVTKILDYAEFWYCDFSVTLPLQSPPLVVSSFRAGAAGLSVKSEALLLSSPPLSTQDISTLRRVAISFTSKDQGWSSYPGSHGTYEASWTWFDVALFSPAEMGGRPTRGALHDEPACGLMPKRYRLQCNRHAGKKMESYNLNLDKSHGHQLFEDLSENDSIALMACAQFSGWQNNVESANLQLWKADLRRAPQRV